MTINTRLGLTGYLSPDGQFFECEYFKHSVFCEVMYGRLCVQEPGARSFRELDERVEDFVNRMGYMAFGSKGYGYDNLSHIRFPGCFVHKAAKGGTRGVNQIQQDWIKDNWDRLDESQQRIITDDMRLYLEEVV